MNILEKTWFSCGRGCIGIVRVETEHDGIKYYIGVADGLDEDDDALHIANWGSTFDYAAGCTLFGVKQ